MLAGRKPRHGAKDQHRGQRRQRPHAGVGHQPPRLVVGVRGLGDLRVEGIDVLVEPGQQRQALVAPLGRVRRQRERLQLRATATREQRAAGGQTLIQGDGVQPVLQLNNPPKQANASSLRALRL